jgi:tRNA(Ile)-lysidine synthase
MDVQKRFSNFITANKLFDETDSLLVACSGGADSVALCHLLQQGGYRFSIAHCNFQLRGEESSRDEAFVRQLAEQYAAPIFVKRFDTGTYAADKKLSVQAAARELRYEWFYSLLNELESFTVNAERKTINNKRQTLNTKPQTLNAKLLTAHHADDNIETVLMNLFKGTGIGGFHGILPKKGKLVRPLLFAKKEEITEYALANGLQWVEDSSNASDKYTRNFFRHQVIPLVAQTIPNAANNVLATIQYMQEAEMIYTDAIAQYKKKLLEPKGNEVHIPVLKLAKLQPLNTILYGLVKGFGFTPHQMPDAVALLQSNTGKYVASATHRIIKNRNWLIIAPVQPTEALNILIEEIDETIVFEEGELTIMTALPNHENPSFKSPTQAMLDAKHIKFPLLLRKWKPGDYFYPLGMPKKKKIARFLIDQKVSKTDKEKIWVIESDKKIIWVVGQRIDDRFKVEPGTKSVVKFTFHP